MIRRRRGRGRAASGPVEERFDPTATAEILRRVVRPVVTGLIRPEELEHLAVGRLPGPGGRRALVVAVQACGESFTLEIWHEGLPERGTKEVAVHLGEQLEDWVCRTRFAWGQRRRVAVGGA